MDIAFVLALLLTFFLALVSGYLVGIWWLVRRVFAQWHERAWGWRLMAMTAALLFAASPYLAFKGLELRYVLARVPDPLRAVWIEYRLERSWGIGLPGDNETGFVVYRLTDGSSEWSRRMGTRLGHALEGPGRWEPTPVRADDTSGRWNRHGRSAVNAERPDFRQYLNQWGYEIPVDQKRIDEANRVVRSPGSFYQYGRSASITVIDPKQGRVYFAYAG